MRPRLGIRRPALATVGALLALAGCSGAASSRGSGGPTGARGTTGSGAPTAAQRAAVAAGASAALTDSAGIEWLCRPGRSPEPCRSDLSAVVIPASGPSHVQRTALPADAPVDCFYVYPTVSSQKTAVADLHVDPAETFVATTQASRFSQVCRVYAPMYRQLTDSAILSLSALTAANSATAYHYVEAAWTDYLAHYNHGRGVVLIGHSQGAAMVTALLRRMVDGNPAVRRRLVSAIVLGGNVTVPTGRTVGGSFAHIPACTSSTETGCVIAYSTFSQAPPAGSLFGRPGIGVSFQVSLLPDAPGEPHLPPAALQVLCVNPAAPGGGTADLDPYFPSGASAPWTTDPGLYQARCTSANGATWLQVTAPVTPGDHRPVVGQTLGPLWGLHQVDVNIALGDLVNLVQRESGAYRSDRAR
ncbi:MAG TPA: DUF3089 domain-containing protein [Acidimicrobiales bacterium]|nr:DUF3089 domain-containing protein [Acidimicrobiales bacterium]